MYPFWVYAEIVLRPYRWADDGWQHASRRNISEGCLYMDQASYADVLPDMASGYMLFHNTLNCLPEVLLSRLCVNRNLLTRVVSEMCVMQLQVFIFHETCVIAGMMNVLALSFVLAAKRAADLHVLKQCDDLLVVLAIDKGLLIASMIKQ